MGPKVGLLWRREWDPFEPGAPVESTRLHGVFRAFADLGVEARPIVYADDAGDLVRRQLLELDAALVWVNPIEHGLDRSRLDPLLREIAASGVFVSAHPDVILKMGTKRVLWDTRELSWGSETRLYETADDLRATLPGTVARRPRVLKQYRGMGGNGVWKIEAADGRFLVQHAADGETRFADTEQLVALLTPYLAGGPILEQPYQARLAEGMIRAYLCHDRVVGFTHQYPRGLMPTGPDDRPTGKLFESPDEERYAALRQRLEAEWVPKMQRMLELETESLPVIWDADFLFVDGDDTFVLCEINASSTFAFPEFAMPAVARATLGRIRVSSEGWS